MEYNRKIFTVSLEVLELTGVRNTTPEDVLQYLKEMLELPQHPETEVGHPFYVIGVDWESVVKFGESPIKVDEDTVIEDVITLGKGNYDVKYDLAGSAMMARKTRIT